MLRYLTGGESHGRTLIAILEGIPAGLSLSCRDIDGELKRRQVGYGRGERMKIEKDRAEILSGVRGGRTLGSPISLMIRNLEWPRWQRIMAVEENIDSAALTQPRPGHADLAGVIKYDFEDIRDVLERASARETAVRVAVGAICKKFLREFGIDLYSRVIQIGKIRDKKEWQPDQADYPSIESSSLRCLDREKEKQMRELIDQARVKGDSLGGIFEIYATNLPIGLGGYTQWDVKLDARLAKAIMSIQAIVGVEIGLGFASAERWGSRVQDEIFYDGKKGRFFRKTNRAGGIEGGMTNGETLIMRAAMKPISTLARPLRSVDLITKKEVKAARQRADICAVPAAAVIGEAVVAFEIAREVREKFGGDSLAEVRRNYQSYINYVAKKQAR